MAAAGLPLAWATVVSAAPPPVRKVEAPLRLLSTGHLAVDVHVNGQGPFRLILDTGAPYTFINSRTARALGLLTEKAAAAPAFFGMRGRTVLKTVRLESAEAANLDAMLLDHPIVDALSTATEPLQGILGMSFLGRFRSTIDYQARVLTLEPNGHTPTDLFPNLLGSLLAPPPTRTLAAAGLWGIGLGVPEGRRGVPVAKVYAGAPAARAGLKVGDRILSIDGRWCDTVEECLEAAGRARPGRRVALRVARGETELDLFLTPAPGL